MPMVAFPARKRIITVLIASIAVLTCGHAQNPLKLWYRQPAARWNEALPIGNGRLGAMVFGRPGTEVLQLNESSIWAGEPGNNVVDDGVYESIQQIRRLLFADKYKEAQDMSNRVFPRSPAPGNNYGMPYQPAGNLAIRFAGDGQVTDYYRDLDLQQAITSVSYVMGGVHYHREAFASVPGQVIALRITADRPHSIHCDLSFNSPHKKSSETYAGSELRLTGQTSDVDNKKGRIVFDAIARPLASGGRLHATDSSIAVEGADTLTVYISIATNYISYNNISADAAARAAAYLAGALTKDYRTLRAEHIAAYQHYFNRVSLDLGTTPAAAQPTDERIARFAHDNDPQLVALYFQFGRYLLISASQPGGQPANLQGIWNDKLSPPWDSKYTVNINTEMNYWPAEPTQLPEMHQPLFAMLKDLSVTGQTSASVMYHARGWNLHHNTDLWRITGPVDGGFYGMWPMGGAWLSQHLWQHFLFGGDPAFLRSVYPILKGAALFYVDALQEEPTHHWLVVAPSMSPENNYLPGVGLSAGTTMDNQLVFDVFSNFIDAAGYLHQDKALADTVSHLRDRLPPMQVGQYGQLQEWLHDWDNPKSNHRHISHLYGLFPSNQISLTTSPVLLEAARNSLVYRGDKSTGWSMGWKVNWWARLHDGNHAWQLIHDQLSPAPPDEKGQSGGTYPNLFDAHPPFQIDGNFGCTSGIAEMLVQSQDGALELLPALPDEWKNGKVSGLMARGGFAVAMEWKDGRLVKLTLHSRIGGNCRLRSATALALADGKPLATANGANKNIFYHLPDIQPPLVSARAKLSGITAAKKREYDLPTQPGKTYVLLGQ